VDIINQKMTLIFVKNLKYTERFKMRLNFNHKFWANLILKPEIQSVKAKIFSDFL